MYGDESQWAKQQTPIFTFLSFINASKYPPSLLYILMTIGPAMIFLAFTEKPLQTLGNVIATYGKVPMFYYILHFYLIHIAAKVAGLLSGYSLDQVLNSGPFGQPLPGYGFRLWEVYLVWLIIVALLYPLCKRYARYKSAHPEKWWLSYL
jgi:hypothetical protein